MKKIVFLVVAVLLIGQISSTAFAHGTSEKHGHHGVDAALSLCNEAGCSVTTIHQHGGKYYYGHSMGDGHDYHSFCTVKSCALAGVHQHNGAYYFEHTLEDGHDYHAACSVKGCTKVTGHTHDADLHRSHRHSHHKTGHN